MPTLAVWTPDDGLLAAVAPLALAVAGPDATLVADLDEAGPRYPGDGSLADLAVDGPRRSDLEPERRRGTAVLRNGGISAVAALEVVEALVAGWPSVVLRLPPRPDPDLAGLLDRHRIPLVPVIALPPVDLWPDRLAEGAAAVMQPTRWRQQAPRPGPVLPRPRGGSWESLLRGRIRSGDRWVRAWRSVWEFPWR
ncbi:MAG: hypothetical protein HKN01_09940 [Acidimicrobiia bacterium]|nr:hypothetical protein [Acidimicrobiia bacterium]NNF70082.1 hypothetical protein [Acidimicrobiia bacterium]